MPNITDSIKIIARNKKAEFQYEIFDKYEAGIVLTGQEVKSIRDGKVAFSDSYIEPNHSELYIVGFNITAYTNSHLSPDRRRKLLLHRIEINKIIGKISEKGFTVIPLTVYIKKNLVKFSIGLAKGKTKYDKRIKIKEREMKRELKEAKW
jgi:SsrA-binding protein